MELQDLELSLEKRGQPNLFILYRPLRKLLQCFFCFTNHVFAIEIEFDSRQKAIRLTGQHPIKHNEVGKTSPTVEELSFNLLD